MLTITTCPIYKVPEGFKLLDVTVKSAKGNLRALAPTWEMILGYKDGTLSKTEYTTKYLAILEKSLYTHPESWDKLLAHDGKIAFGCYCKTGNFCHRLLLADFVFNLASERDINVLYHGEEP